MAFKPGVPPCKTREGCCDDDVQDLSTKWHEVKQLVPDRDMVLRNELMRQQNNERLRRAFAQKANVVGQWIERHLDAVATASMQRGKLEDNLSRLYALDKEVAAFRPSFDELERYNQDIQEAMIFDNRHTPYTMEVAISLLIYYRSRVAWMSYIADTLPEYC